MAKYTRDQVLSRYRELNPEDKTGDNRLFLEIMNSNPKLKNSVISNEYESGMSNSYLDWLPEVIKEGYNRSLTGTADELMSGKKRFDMSKWNPGVVEDLASSVISLMVPTDWLALGPAGRLGGAVGKVAFKSFATAGVPKKLASDAVRKAISKKIGSQAAVFSTFEGLGNGLRQQIDTGQINFEEMSERALKGAVTGAVAGTVGGTLGARGASSFTKVAAEAGAIGTTSPLLEGEIPTPQDYFHTAGVILGVKGGNKLFSSTKNIRRLFEERPETVKYKLEKQEADIYAKGVEKHDMESAFTTDSWSSKSVIKKGEGFGNVRIQRKRGDKFYQVEDLKTKESKPIRIEKFHQLYNRKSGDISSKKLRGIRENEIRSLERELGYTKDSTLQQIKRKGVWRHKMPDAKSALRNAKDVDLYNYKQKLQLEANIKNTSDRLQKEGVIINNVPRENFIDAYLPKPLVKFLEPLKSADMRIKDPMGRKYILDVNKYFDRKAQLFSQYIERGNDIGMKTPSKKELRKMGFKNDKEYWEDITAKKEAGQLPEWDFLTNAIHKEAVKAGVQVPGRLKHYVPRMLKPEVAEIIFNDYMKISQKMTEASNLFDTFSKTKDWIKNNPEKAQRLEDLIKSADFSARTKSALNRHLEPGEYSHVKAFAKIGKTVYNDLFNPFGNLEKSRTADKMPTEFYERDWRALYHKYAMGSAKRISEVEQFGRKGEKFKALRKAVEMRDNKGEAGIMQNIHEHITDSIHRDPARNFSPETKKRLVDLMAFETGTKIALGTATIPNMTQFMISSALDAGYWRFFKGVASLASPKMRRAVKESGATEWQIVNEMIGTNSRTATSSYIADRLSTWSQFKRINTINQYTAAATSRIFIKDLHRYANGKGLRKSWARNKLAKMGVDYRNKLNENTLRHGMYRFAKDMNLQKDILKDPLIMNNPRTQWFFQFKRFGLRQFKLVDGLLRQDLKQGNIMSLLRLGIAGYAGGPMVSVAKKYYKQILGGEPVYDPEAKLPEDLDELVGNLSAVGAFGMMGDILTVATDVTKSPTKAIKFLALPAVWGDVEKLTQFSQELESDSQKLGPAAWKRLPARIVSKLGTAPSTFIQRFYTEGMAEEKLEGRKRFAVKSINKLIDDDQWDEALERARIWNRTFPRNPITDKSIGYHQILRRKMERIKALYKNNYDVKGKFKAVREGAVDILDAFKGVSTVEL